MKAWPALLLLATGCVTTGQLDNRLDELRFELTGGRTTTPVERPMLPVGAVIVFPGDATAFAEANADYKLCDGAAVAVRDYPDLFAAIGWTYGRGGEATTTDEKFSLPDYRGQFLRGVDGGRGVDPDRAQRQDIDGAPVGDAVGSRQGHLFYSHGHGVSDPGHAHSYSDYRQGGGGNEFDNGGDRSFTDQGRTTSGAGTGISIGAAGGSETRPVNIAVHYFIKVK